MTQTYPLILLMVTKYQLDESLMDDSQTYIILYGKSPPPLKTYPYGMGNIGPTRAGIQTPYWIIYKQCINQ